MADDKSKLESIPQETGEIESVIAFADRPNPDFLVIPEMVLRSMHDGVRFFWIESQKCLVFRGKPGDLPKSGLKSE